MPLMLVLLVRPLLPSASSDQHLPETDGHYRLTVSEQFEEALGGSVIGMCTRG